MEKSKHDMRLLGEAQVKLIKALRDAGAPQMMVDKALDGEYDDYKSPHTFNMQELIKDAKRCGLRKIEQAAKRGDFDGTKADSDAWAASPEGKATAGNPEVVRDAATLLDKSGLGRFVPEEVRDKL